MITHDAKAEDLDEENGRKPADEGEEMVFFLRPRTKPSRAVRETTW